MKNIGDVFKKDPNEMLKRYIKKQFPKLADVDFDVKQTMDQCPSCEEDNIPIYWIKRETDKEFQEVPGKIKICLTCETKELSKREMERAKRLVSEKATSRFWVIPPELNSKTLENYKPADTSQIQALKTAGQYLKDFQNKDFYTLFFRGTYGGGKSHLMKAIAEKVKAMTRKDEDGYDVPMTVGFMTMDTLLAMIKGTFGRREGETEHTIVQAIIELDFLVIDDLGTESGEWAGKKLFEIVNGRAGKPTAYTSNFMEWDELAKRFDINGGKIVSRIRANANVHDLITEDMRARTQRG